MMHNSSGSFFNVNTNSYSIYLDSWIAYDFEWKTEKSQKPIKCDIDGIASEASMPPALAEGKEYNEIVTFGFADRKGNKGCYDITDFTSTKLFLEAIKEKLLQYKYCFAWGSKAVVRKNVKTGDPEGINGDLVVLDSNFKKNGISSIVKYNEFSGLPYIEKDIFTKNGRFFQADIDLLKVFSKPLVRLIFKNKYKSLHLDEVCKALLSFGKLNDKTGAKLEEMSIEERKAYCIHDAHMVADLVRIENGDILKIMQIISNHTGLSFEEVCHKGMTGIWKKMLDNEIRKKINLVGYNSIPNTLRELYSNKSMYSHGYNDYIEDHENEGDEENEDTDFLEFKENSYDLYMDMLELKSKERKSNSTFTTNDLLYNKQWSLNNNGKNMIKTEKGKDKDNFKGGLVLIPIRGLHHDVYLMDTVSMYPTIIINSNLSPETVNCTCCKDNQKSKVLFDEDIAKDLVYLHESSETHYWICQKRVGLFSKILKELTKKRIQYKKEGKELESLAMKIIINSGYGVFGYWKFKFYDPRVAEIVTAFGRQTLSRIKKIAEEKMNFVVLYGDSDSIFCNNIKSKYDIIVFVDKCKQELHVEVNHEKTFKKLILVSKKHYIGILEDVDKDPVIKGMEGIKSDRPEFIRTAFINLVEDFKHERNPIPRLKDVFNKLDKRKIPKEKLAISLVLSKNPQDYVTDGLQKRLGLKNNIRKGDTLVYYKCDKQEIVVDKTGNQKIIHTSESDNPDDISYAKYKELLLNSVKDVIEILGYSVEKDLLTKKKSLDLSADN